MVAAVSGAASKPEPQSPKITPSQDGSTRRPPLLPSEKDNSNGISSNQRKPKSRVVSSRYMSPSTSTSTSNSSSVSSSSSSSRRYPSPLVSRNSSTPVSNTSAKRSVSVDRRRPSAIRPLASDLASKHGSNADISAATKMLITSTRSLSVSFQGEAFSLPISKTKATPPSPNSITPRKGTPERRRTVTPSKGKADGVWPARNRLANPLSRSLDCSQERSNLIGSVNGVRGFQQSMIDERRPSYDGRSSLDLGSSEILKAFGQSPNGNSNSVNNEVSDSDSVSSGSTSGVQECGRSGPRGIAVSARFWQETNSRLRRLQDPGSPLSPGSKMIGQPKLKRYTSESGSFSSPRMMSSPIRGGARAASPGKLVGSSPSRGQSPSRVRNAVSTISNSFSETPSVLSYAVDVRRGKVGENRIVDAHLLRLLYNRHVQWRFANARTEAVWLVQKRGAEKSLWNAWITISDLRDTVTKKRHRLQLLRQKLKLASILKRQMNFLEDWASLDKDHMVSLVGAIESLKASTLRLPVVGGASTNVQSLQDAISSAFDIMQAMTTSIYLLLPMAEEVNSLVSELAKVTAKERALLEQCTDSISLLAAMQVKDSSLRTHILQQHNRL